MPDCSVGSASKDFWRISAMKSSTTDKATSDSSKAWRISSQVVSISEDEIFPRERRDENAPLKREVKDSNIRAEDYFNACLRCEATWFARSEVSGPPVNSVTYKVSIASAPRVVTMADRISIFDSVIAAPILNSNPGRS